MFRKTVGVTSTILCLQTDGWTDRQAESSIHPLTTCYLGDIISIIHYKMNLIEEMSADSQCYINTRLHEKWYNAYIV